MTEYEQTLTAHLLPWARDILETSSMTGSVDTGQCVEFLARFVAVSERRLRDEARGNRGRPIHGDVGQGVRA